MRKHYIKTLYILITVLFVALIAQGYFIYTLQEQVNKKENQQLSIELPKSSQVSYQTHSIDPFKEIQKIQEHMMQEFGNFNSMFANDPFFQNAFSNSHFSPMSDIKEENAQYIIEIKIPGVDEQNINITTDENMIQISAESQNNSDEENTNYIRRESFGHYFKRTFTLPQDADVSTIKSDYKDGVLKVLIQKKNN